MPPHPLLAALCLGFCVSAWADEEIPANLSVSLPNGESMRFVYIPPGTFTMGSAAEGDAAPHEVTISQGFYIGRREITRDQWEAVMGTTPWGLPFEYNPTSPATELSWVDVQGFIQKLNLQEDEDLFRLPTEAEWEYACRAGSTTRYHFGDDPALMDQYAWHRGNSVIDSLVSYPPPSTNPDVQEELDARGPDISYIIEVQSSSFKTANPWGLYGMYGNAAEWVHDWYSPSYYNNSPPTDPSGPAGGSQRVVRGGNIHTRPAEMGSAARDSYAPDTDHREIGARLVRLAPQPPAEAVEAVETAVPLRTWGRIKETPNR